MQLWLKFVQFIRFHQLDRKLKVLYVVNVMAVGGAEIFLLRKMQILRSRGHEVNIAYWQKEGEKIDEYLQKYLNNEGIFNISNNFNSITPILRALNPQIIHTVEGHPRYLKTAVKAMPGIICVSNQTAMVWKAEYNYDHRRYTDAIVTASYDFKKIILERLRKPSRLVKVIFYGVDCDRFTPARPTFYVLEKKDEKPIDLKGKKVVLQLARINPIKNIEDSLKIAEMLVAKDPNIVFLLAGGCRDENRDYYEQLKQLRAEYQLQNHYFFMGERSDISDLIALSHCVICTTKACEGTPNAILEAMAMAKPIAAFDCPGMFEVVRNGKTGYLVKSGDVQAAASQINALLVDEMLRARLGGQARQIVLQKFSLNRAVNEYEKLYRSLVRTKPFALFWSKLISRFQRSSSEAMGNTAQQD